MLKAYFDPSYLSVPDAQLAEAAAQQLKHCPALVAFMVRRHENLGDIYDRAKDMEKVRDIRGRRKEIVNILALSVADRPSSHTLTDTDE